MVIYLSASSIYLPIATTENKMRLFSNLRSLGRRLSRFKVFHPLRPLGTSILYTAEPAGHIWIDNTPVIPSHQGREQLTIISANLWHDFPQYRRIQQRLQAFVQMVTVENADILLLQEVARTPWLQVNEWLSRRLNMAYVYSRVNGHQKGVGFEEGLAILSRYPLRTPNLLPLGKSQNPFVRRLALGAVIDTPCGGLHVFSTHLSLTPKQNNTQILQLQEWVDEICGDQAAIIGGDFNAHETRPGIRKIQTEWVDTLDPAKRGDDTVTHEFYGFWGKPWLRQRLDYIFLKPGHQSWQVIETNHLHNPEMPHSDHKAVLTRLILG